MLIAGKNLWHLFQATSNPHVVTGERLRKFTRIANTPLSEESLAVTSVVEWFYAFIAYFYTYTSETASLAITQLKNGGYYFPSIHFHLLLRRQFHVRNVGGNGNCGFRAVTRALLPYITAAEEDAVQSSLRRLTVSHLTAHKERFLKDHCLDGQYYKDRKTLVPFDAYIEEMMKETTMADELAMLALSEALNTPIYLYSPKNVLWDGEKMIPVDSARLGERYHHDADPIHLICMNHHFQTLYDLGSVR